MFFRQVLYSDLGCASYVLGDAGEAVVVDPRWDIDVYLEIAAEQHLVITHVLDTHDHADHVSGRMRLVQATGARAHRPGSAHDDAADLISPGAEVSVGALRIRALATPGHRPEHLAFAVADLSRGAEPWVLLSGDSLLVGDVARPDLAYEPHEGAMALHATLAELLALGDDVELWPAHVGGSLCGGESLSDKTSSTVGFERRHNRLLTMDDETSFVDAVIESLPSRPPNIDRIVALNRRPSGSSPAQPPLLEPWMLERQLVNGATVLDCRVPDRFDEGHLAGAVNLPVNSPGVGTRAGWALDPELPIVIVAGDEPSAHGMVSALQAVGFWKLGGYCLANPGAWTRAALPVARTDSWDVSHLADGVRAGTVELIDVRELPEWISGHVAGSHHVPSQRLRDVSSVPPAGGRTTAVACAAGARAAFAASLLRRAGRHDVVRVAGGGIRDLGAHGIELALGA